jgi:hypothetical protein
MEKMKKKSANAFGGARRMMAKEEECLNDLLDIDDCEEEANYSRM